MITKAIVKRLNEVNNNIFRVYVPVLKNVNMDETDATFDATLCSFNYANDLRVGDIVFVDFEENVMDKPIILGKLFLNNKEENNSQLILKTLNVKEKLTIPNNCKIGNIDLNDLVIKIKDLLEKINIDNNKIE